MPRMGTSRGHDWEYWYTLFALLFLSNALVPLLYDLGGTHVESYSDSNPLKLALATGVYLIAAWLILMIPGRVMSLLQQNPWVIAVLALPVLSVLWSVEPETSFRRAAASALTVVFCIYLAARLSPEELLKRLMFVLLLGGVASVLYALAFPEYGIHHDSVNPGSWKGVYGHKNDLGRVSAIALIVAYFVRPSNPTERFYRVLTIAIFLFLLGMSQSRSNWFIILGVVGLVPLLRVLQTKTLGLPLRFLTVVTFGIGAILMVAVLADQLLFAVGRDDSFSGRETLWRGVIAIVNEHYPFLGAGYGAFFSNHGGVQWLDPYLDYWTARPNHAHNGYLNVWADLGGTGLILLIVFLVTSTVHLLRRVLCEPHRPAWLALSALTFLFLLNNISESVALRHSDIAWVLVVVASFYARTPRQYLVRRGVPAATMQQLRRPPLLAPATRVGRRTPHGSRA